MTIQVKLRRQLAILDFCLAALMRHKLKIGALLIVYSLVIFVVTSVFFFGNALRYESAAVLRNAPEIVVQRMLGGRCTPIPRSYGETIAAIEGVLEVTPRYWGYYFHPPAGANYTIQVENGTRLKPGHTEIGRGVARTWEVEAGAPLFFKTYNGRVMGLTVDALMPGQAELVTADLILMHPWDFQSLFGLDKGLATDLSVRVREAGDVRTIAAKISRLLADTRTVLREDRTRTYGALLGLRSGYAQTLLAAAVLSFIIVALDSAMGSGETEHTEIAVLKSIGWGFGDLLTMKFYQGLVISLSAFLIGATAAYVHIFFARAALFENMLKGWSVLYPRFDLVPVVDFGQLACLFGLTVFPYALIAMIPAWRTAAAEPDTVVRRLR